MARVREIKVREERSLITRIQAKNKTYQLKRKAVELKTIALIRGHIFDIQIL